MNYGVIKFFNGLKGYGFITPADGSADIFVHISNVQQGYIPQQDDYVSFDTFQGRKGIEAKDIAVASQQ